MENWLYSTFFIGMDIIKKKPIVTDRNPYLEGLIDMHQCIYLPSAHEKNQNLPDYLTQVRLGAKRDKNEAKCL